MDTKHPITFFIPAYNCAQTIGASIESIFVTNFEEGDELIVVNDCSTDQTLEIVSKYCIRYPEIKLINHKRNKGGASARNSAVENARHDLLFCLDSDNILSDNSIKALKEYLIQSNADVASFQNQHFFTESIEEIHYTWSLPKGEVCLQEFLSGNNTPGQHGNYLFTRQSWINAQGYAEGVGALDTTTFGLRQAITGAKFMVLTDSHYYHRLQDTSYYINDAHKKMWSVSLKMMQALMPFFDRIDERFLDYMFYHRYTWFYNLKNKPIKLVEQGSKDMFYMNLQNGLMKAVYPSASILVRLRNKLKKAMSIRL